ncbi:YpiB family protein [Bacillus suaedae]|uniref:YpiB family protein n=1 Tax=Halalkalibacter suaedae TaxID=2822140 RepID=A0A940X148_9BACI|nr:YpiB family protein [Bacillus suaedae]MBP3952704.1 YpiB family protein [Bacillus suaedae]
MNWVSNVEKGQFLRWFLDQHQLKHKDARMLLEHILKKHHILENLSLTETIQVKERTIVISSVNSDEVGFVYYYHNQKTEDISKAMGDLMANPADKVYLILHFYGKQLNHRYQQLVETPRRDSFKRYKQFKRDSEDADTIIDIALLKERINEALDQRDEHLFKSLVSQLQQLEKR